MERHAISLRQGRLELLPDEVHVWSASLRVSQSALGACARSLSPDESTRAAAFVFERHRKRFVAGRGFLRALLGDYLRRSAEQLEFAYGPHGKPELAGEAESSGLKFNLSHSGELALCAVTLGREVGVDVEAVRPLEDASGVARRFFSPTENAVLNELPAAARLDAFFTCWTRKEAFLKALGDGLARPLDAFDVTVVPGVPARLLHVADRPDEPDRWSLSDLAPGLGFAAALAVDGHGWRLRQGTWRPPGWEGRGWAGEHEAGARSGDATLDRGRDRSPLPALAAGA